MALQSPAGILLTNMKLEVRITKSNFSKNLVKITKKEDVKYCVKQIIFEYAQ